MLYAERPPEDIILKVQIMWRYIFSGYNCYGKMRDDIYADILVLKQNGFYEKVIFKFNCEGVI